MQLMGKIGFSPTPWFMMPFCTTCRRLQNQRNGCPTRLRKHIQRFREQAVGISDRMVHGYTGIDLFMIWDMIEQDLFPLESAIDDMAVLKGWREG